MHSLCNNPDRNRFLRGRTGDEWPRDKCPDSDQDSAVHHENSDEEENDVQNTGDV